MNLTGRELHEKKNRLDTIVVSKILTSEDGFTTALDLGLRPEMITEPVARRTFDLIRKFYEDESRTVPTLDYVKMRGIPFHAIVSPDTLEQTVPALRELSTHLRLLNLHNAIPRLMAGPAAAASEKVYQTALDIAELSKARAPSKTKADLAEDIMQEYIAYENIKDGGSIPYAIPLLSSLLNGKIGNPSVSVFFGQPKSYKTTNLIYDAYILAAAYGYKVYIATGELTQQDIHREMACFHARIDLNRAIKKGFSPEERMSYFQSLKFIASLENLHIGECPKRGILELDLLASRAEKVKPQVIYLDGVHRLPDSPEHIDVIKYAQRVTEHARDTFGAPWVVAAQANRDAAKREYENMRRAADGKKNPRVNSAMLDIAGSKAWIEECTAAIRCVKKGHGRVQLEVTETRWGTVGAVDVIMLRGQNVAEVGLVQDDGDNH